jgi:hypothetical protein
MGMHSNRNFELASPLVYEYSGRRIVVVKTIKGLQPFYRRTGKGSKGEIHEGAQEGDWAPFNGIYQGWFVKDVYCTAGGFKRNDPLYRFGSKENVNISEWLKEVDPRITNHTEDYAEVNAFLESTGYATKSPLWR